jgi:hypothetical protein
MDGDRLEQRIHLQQLWDNKNNNKHTCKLCDNKDTQYNGVVRPKSTMACVQAGTMDLLSTIASIIAWRHQCFSKLENSLKICDFIITP